MARATAGKYWTLRAPAGRARKGRGAAKRQIGRCFHHGVPDVEERAIERHVRQEARRDILRQQRDVCPVSALDVSDRRHGTD